MTKHSGLLKHEESFFCKNAENFPLRHFIRFLRLNLIFKEAKALSATRNSTNLLQEAGKSLNRLSNIIREVLEEDIRHVLQHQAAVSARREREREIN